MKLTKNDRNITIILGEKNEKTNKRKETVYHKLYLKCNNNSFIEPYDSTTDKLCYGFRIKSKNGARH